MKKNPWKNPEYRKRMLAKRREVAKDPKVQEKKRQTMLKLYKEEPERLEHHSKAMKIAWANFSESKLARRSKKLSKKTTAQMNRQWADPVWHSKMVRVRRKQGKKPENVAKLSKGSKRAWARKEYRDKQERTRTKSYAFRVTRLEKISKALVGKPTWNTGQTKKTHPSLARLSKKMMGKIPAWKKYGQYYEGQHGRIWMRSSWEVGYAEWMDRKGIDWEYEPASFKVGRGPWTGETYTPDFYIPKTDFWLDVKGYLSRRNEAKIKSFQKKFPDLKFRLVQYKELRTLGVVTAGGYKKK